MALFAVTKSAPAQGGEAAMTDDETHGIPTAARVKIKTACLPANKGSLK
ncbi:hypothetical protein [Bradyrhizobium sp. USDA 4486]